MLPSILAGLLYPLIPLILAIVGARFQNEYFIYSSVFSILLLLLLRSFKLLSGDTDFFSILCISLSLIIPNTFITDYLVGIDIHGEYYFSYLALKNGWDINLPFQYNSSILIGGIIPLVSKLFNFPLELIYKVILPSLLALVPVFCYYIFKNILTPTKAYLSTIFLISVPTFFLELPGIGKQMVGELLLIGTIYILFFSKLSNIKKGVLALILGGLTVMTHYSMGLILILYILGATLILLGIKYIIKQNISISIKPLISSLLILIVITGVYYSIVIQGNFIKILKMQALLQVAQIYSVLNINYSPVLTTVKSIEKEVIVPPQILSFWLETQKEEDTVVAQASKEVQPSTVTPEGYTLTKYFNDKELTVRAAIGLDFLEQTLQGKIFRIIQYITEILLLLGLILFFLKNYYKINLVYTSLFLVGWGFLALTVISPGFSNILNASRFYHISLLFIAPCIVLPFFNKPKLLLIVLIPYLIFTSGAVFEVLKITNANELGIPYSYGLSGYRADLTTITSKEDIKVLDYLESNNIKEIYADQWGFTFLAERKAQDIWYLPLNCNTIPSSAYIFLRGRNTSTNTVCYWTGVGKRESKTFKECGLDKELEKRSLIKECGSARLYGPRLTNN